MIQSSKIKHYKSYWVSNNPVGLGMFGLPVKEVDSAILNANKKRHWYWLQIPRLRNLTVLQLKEITNGNLWFGTSQAAL